jgi:hypothetical protein
VEVPASVRVAAGSAAVLSVVVTNTAPEPRQLNVLAVGVDQAWLPGPVRTRVLAAGESETVQIRLAPAAGTLPAQYPVAVTVQALLPGTGRAAEAPSGIGESALVVNPRAQLQLEVTPERSSLVRSQRLRVVLRNGGASETEAELEATATKGLEVRLRRRSVSVPAGGEVLLKGRLVASRPRVVGSGTQHTWTVTASGPDAVRRARGTAQQRAVVGRGWLRAVALVAVLGIWVAAAVVFIPRLADRFGGQEDEVVAVTSDRDGDGEDGTGKDGDGTGDGDGASEVRVTQAKSPATPKGLQLNGTVTADDPSGVTVTLEPTSLVDEDAQDATLDAELVSLVGYGKMSESSLLPLVPDDVATVRTAATTDDGTWSFPDVSAPGYYLVTFSKVGYTPAKYVVDSSTVDATEPLEVELEPGEGALSGRVSGLGGGAGAATVTVSDGTSTLTTSTTSRGGADSWAVGGLATPGSYLVQVSAFGLGAESRLIELDAGGTATADVRLRPGQAELFGKIGRDGVAKDDGLGGVTVTVTDDQGLRRAATTVTTKGHEGQYHLPGLPSPGTYTVMLSADGFQTQVSQLDLKEGDSSRRLNAGLVSSTGDVVGFVSEHTSGKRIVGAGLILSNDQFTYKTTSTARDKAHSKRAGTFRFDGVEPGTYQLTTVYFEYETDVVTVRVTAGDRAEAYPEIRVDEDGVLPRTSKILGNAIDRNSRDAVACDDTEPCTATILFDDPPANSGDYTTDFTEGEEYTLPSKEGLGLGPGLYTVEVTAPGYETTQVRVQVPLDTKVFAPTAEMTRLPTITGTITVSRGSPEAGAQTCVWAVPFGASTNVGDCADAQDDICLPAGGPRTTLPRTGTVCEYGNALDPYLLELPTAGTYTLIAKMDDLAYSPIEIFPVNVSPGGTAVHNLDFIRKAEVEVVAHTLDANGTPQPTAGVSVALVRVNADGTATPVPGDPKVTNSGGTVRFVGLNAGTYRATGSKAGLRDAVGETQVEINQTQSVHLTLGDVPQPFVVQVVGDNNVALDNATVEVTAPDRYDGKNPIYVTEQATTVVPQTGPPDPDGCVVFHDVGAAVTALAPCDDTYATASRTEATFASAWADRIRVTAPGYEELVTARRMMTSVMQLRLEPSPVRFTSSVTAEGAQLAFQDVTFSVTSSTTSTGTISVSADANGTIIWNDVRYPTGVIRPGSYTLTASAAGYVSEPVTFKCLPGVDCVTTGPVLKQLGSLVVRAEDGGAPINDVRVTLFRGNLQVGEALDSATDDNEVVFPDLLPNEGDYRIRVQAAGYEFGSGTLLCNVGSAPDTTTSIVIAPGTETVCAANLPRLPRITGTVEGVLAAPSEQGQVRSLAGAQITATACTAWHPPSDTAAPQYCTEVSTRRFAAITGPDGSFTITGTKQAEGLTAGVWLLRVNEPGWSMVSSSTQPDAMLGVAVRVGAAGTGDVTQDVSLYADPVQFDVHVQNQYGAALPGATVQLLRGAALVATAVPVTGDPGNYRFAGAIPGTYTVQVTGNGVVRTTALADIKVAVPTQSFTMSVSRAANSLRGTVASADAPSGLVGVAVTLHACESATNCASTTAVGTDGNALSTSTADDGSFELRTVPDGLFQARFSKRKYDTAVGGPFTFDHNLGPISPLAITMAKVLRSVAIRVDTSPSGGDLSGATAQLLPIPAGSNPTPSEQALQPGTGGAAGSYTTTFNQIAYGCWNIKVTLPPGHHGAVTVPAGLVGHPDDSCSGHVVVGDGGGPVSGRALVTETKVSFGVAATPVSGHPPPQSAGLTLVGVDVPGYPLTDPVVLVGGTDITTIWLPPGKYKIEATGLNLGAVQAFWPTATEEFTVAAGDQAKSVTATLVERLGKLTVRAVEADGSLVAGTITVAQGTDQLAAVPGAYANPVATTGELGLDLPSGNWDITVTPTDGRPPVTQTDVALVSLTRTVSITIPPPPP